MTSTNSRYCTRCNKASKACICEAIVAIDNNTEIVIIQHPSEGKHPMGTARILELSLSRCTLIVTDSPQTNLQLKTLCDNHRCYLLYPHEEASIASLELLAEHREDTQKQPVFILLDATWRKAYGLLASSERLQQLPKVQLSEAHQGRYRVRATSVKGGLSTVEAAAYLLSDLEGKPCGDSLYQPLLRCLDTMVDFQLAQMPKEVLERY